MFLNFKVLIILAIRLLTGRTLRATAELLGRKNKDDSQWRFERIDSLSTEVFLVILKRYSALILTTAEADKRRQDQNSEVRKTASAIRAVSDATRTLSIVNSYWPTKNSFSSRRVRVLSLIGRNEISKCYTVTFTNNARDEEERGELTKKENTKKRTHGGE